MEEVWKDIDGYEGYYQVSNLGKVKSLARYVESISKSGKIYLQPVRSRILRTSLCGPGYPIVHLYKDGERSNVMVHRLVALSFLDIVEGKDFVNHKDGDKTNNLITNLEWSTKSENTLHAIDTGLLKRRGEDSNWSKLSERQALEILSLRTFGKRKYFAKDIAKIYGLCEKYVSGFDKQKSWSSLRDCVDEDQLYDVFLEVSATMDKSILSRTPSKYKITEKQSEEILKRRSAGERVCDIATDMNLPPKFISWYTTKHKDKEC